MTTQTSGDVLSYVDRDGNIHEVVGVVDLSPADVRRLAAVFGPTESVEFADGDVLLAPVELTDAVRADNGLRRILSVALLLKVANAAHVDAVLFDAAPVGSYTPGDAFGLDVHDVDKVISVFHIDQWAALGVAICISGPQAQDKFYTRVLYLTMNWEGERLVAPRPPASSQQPARTAIKQ